MQKAARSRAKGSVAPTSPTTKLAFVEALLACDTLVGSGSTFTLVLPAKGGTGR